MDSTNLADANTLIGERVVPRTKQAYEAKIRTIASYYTERLHQPVTRITVPVDRDDCYAPSLLFVFCFQLCLSVLCCYVLSGGMCVALADVTHCCPLVLTSALHVAT